MALLNGRQRLREKKPQWRYCGGALPDSLAAAMAALPALLKATEKKATRERTPQWRHCGGAPPGSLVAAMAALPALAKATEKKAARERTRTWHRIILSSQCYGCVACLGTKRELEQNGNNDETYVKLLHMIRLFQKSLYPIATRFHQKSSSSLAKR